METRTVDLIVAIQFVEIIWIIPFAKPATMDLWNFLYISTCS